MRSRLGHRRPPRARSLVVLALALACAAPERAGPAARAPVAVRSGVFEAGFARVEAAGQGLAFLLPDAAGWRHDPREQWSWVATHAATHSRLVVRAWRADAIAPVAACERQMRVWRPDLPAAPAEGWLETRALELTGDTAAELSTGVSEPSEAPGKLLGYAQLVASDGRRCFYLGYATSAGGRDVARVIGERLAVIAGVVFERVQRLDLSERIQGERKPGPPP